MKPTHVSRVAHLLSQLCYLLAKKDDRNQPSLVSEGMRSPGRGAVSWMGQSRTERPVAFPARAAASHLRTEFRALGSSTDAASGSSCQQPAQGREAHDAPAFLPQSSPGVPASSAGRFLQSDPSQHRLEPHLWVWASLSAATTFLKPSWSRPWILICSVL